MSVFRGRATPGSSARGFIPRGYPTAGIGTRYTDISLDCVEDAKRTIAFDAALSFVASLVSELELTFWSAPFGDTTRRRVDAPAHFEEGRGGLAGDGFDIHDWMFQALVSLIARGNLFGRALEEKQGVITQCDILHPDHVRPPTGIRPTDVRIPEGQYWLVDGASDPSVRHWRAEAMPGTLLAPSLVATHAIQLRLPQVAAAFGAQWFQDGGHPSSLLTNEYADANSFGSKGAKRLKEEFMASMQGRREPVILGRGWKYQQVSVTAEESQFLATLGYSEAEVAHMFGPGVAEMLGYGSSEGGGLTYANLESRAAHVLTFGVGKWINRMQRVLRAMCPPNVWPWLDTSKIINATPAELYKAVSIALACRLMTPNEARAMAGLASVPWGDEPNPIAGANTTNSNEDNIPAGDPVPPKSGGKKK